MVAEVRFLDDARETREADPDWRKQLATHNGKILGDERNLIAALRAAPALAGLLQFNEFSQRIEFSRQAPWRETKQSEAWTDEDDTAATAWFQRQEIGVRTRGAVADSVALVARECTVHPVRSYLEHLVWDKQARLATWLNRYLGAFGNSKYLAAVGRKFLISAAARVQQPGCQADHTMVMEGPQGSGKSSAARLLACHTEWFTDDLPDVHSKDGALQLCGRWIVELPELAALRKSETESMKAFLTRPTDVYRPPYARRAVAVPRQCVFIATTNDAQYLRDPTGNRRFWPVSCGVIDLEGIARDRDQLWAEALVAFRTGEPWHLTHEEALMATEEQRERVLTTELEADVGEYLHRMQQMGTQEVTVKEVLVHALGLDPDGPDYAERAGRLGVQVAGALQRCGWNKVRTLGRGENRRTVYRSAHRDAQG